MLTGAQPTPFTFAICSLTGFTNEGRQGLEEGTDKGICCSGEHCSRHFSSHISRLFEFLACFYRPTSNINASSKVPVRFARTSSSRLPDPSSLQPLPELLGYSHRQHPLAWVPAPQHSFPQVQALGWLQPLYFSPQAQGWQLLPIFTWEFPFLLLQSSNRC